MAMMVLVVALQAYDGLPETNDKVLMHLLEQTKATGATRQVWRPIQEEARDTVVQIFAQVAELDLLQPYKTPAQYGCRGSGFFINELGDIITNAHVVEQAMAVWIQIPSLGKRLIDVDIIGICPDRDLALLRVSSVGLALVRNELGLVPYLALGDSDKVSRADEVLAIGYPLGQESLKSTTGIISGREKNLIQMSAPINPGSSGGPLLNNNGEVIGINTSGITDAQNIGYSIPSNDLSIILPDLYAMPLVRKPYTGIIQEFATDALTHYLGNPQPGGSFVIGVVAKSPAAEAGINVFDMIYEANGYPVDMYGDMKVPWSEDKISLANYTSRLALGERVDLVVYRAGQRLQKTLTLNYSDLLPIRRVYPGYEKIDYEVFGGLVVMELTHNHMKIMSQVAGLARYTEMKNQTKPVLVITHIFPNSQAFRTRTLMPGFIISEINGQEVFTLNDFRQALSTSQQTGYLTIKATDTLNKISDNIFVVLPYKNVLEEEEALSRMFHYPITETGSKLLAAGFTY